MQFDPDPLDGDPIFAWVRDARPAVPSALAGDVLARVTARPRAAMRPVIVGALVAAAMLACVVMLMVRGDERASNELYAGAPVNSISTDAGAPPRPADAPIGAPLVRAAWTNLPVLWGDLERGHHDTIERCRPNSGSTEIAILVVRQGDGTARASYPVPGLDEQLPISEQRCRSRAIEAIQLPDLPLDLSSVTFSMSFPPIPLPRKTMAEWKIWRDPVRTIRDALNVRRTQLWSCVVRPRTFTFVVDTRPTPEVAHGGRSWPTGLRVWLPQEQIAGDRDPSATMACFQRVLATVKLRQFPPFLDEVRVSYEVTK